MPDPTPQLPAAPPLRKPGRVPAHWVFRPYFALWAIALAATIVLGARRMPELTAFVAALYLCTGFFGHTYTIAWRTGSRLWRVLSWSIAASMHLFVIALQTDHAGARVVHAATGITTRAPEPGLFAPVGMMAAAIVLLTLHLVWLGTGDREPTETEKQALARGPRFAPGSRLTRPVPEATMPARSTPPPSKDEDS